MYHEAQESVRSWDFFLVTSSACLMKPLGPYNKRLEGYQAYLWLSCTFWLVGPHQISISNVTQLYGIYHVFAFGWSFANS